MKELLTERIPLYTSVKLTLKSGEVLDGYITAYEDAFLQFMSEDGKFRPIPYALIEQFAGETFEYTAASSVISDSEGEEKRDIAGAARRVPETIPAQNPVTPRDGEDYASMFAGMARDRSARTIEQPDISRNEEPVMNTDTPAVVAQPVQETSKNGVTEGKVASFNAVTGFGYVSDREGNYYQFVRSNLAPECRDAVVVGMPVTFTCGKIWSKKKNDYMPGAFSIEPMMKSGSVSTQSAENTTPASSVVGEELEGEIRVFNPVTTVGNVLCNGKKYTCSHKDIADYAISPLDCSQYVYQVLFRIDYTKRVPKACDIRVIGKRELTEQEKTANGVSNQPAASVQQHVPGEVLEGFIAYYNASTKAGNVGCGDKRYNFSHKDFVDFDASTIDLSKYDYSITFELDSSTHITKACFIRVISVEESDGREDEMLDADAPATALLQFLLGKFSLSVIQGYLPQEDRGLIDAKGNYIGGYTEAQRLVKECERKTDWAHGLERKLNPVLYLTAAKIIRQCMERGLVTDEHDSIFCEKHLNSCLYTYAKLQVLDGNTESQAETLYLSESVLGGSFRAYDKNKIMACCMSEYFDKSEIRRKASVRHAFDGFQDVLKIYKSGACNSADGMAKTLMNFPKESFGLFMEGMVAKYKPALYAAAAAMGINGILAKDAGPEEDACISPEEVVAKMNELYGKFNFARKDLQDGLGSVNAEYLLDSLDGCIEVIEKAEESLFRFLFEVDMQYLGSIRTLLGDIDDSLSAVNPSTRVQNVENAVRRCLGTVRKIEDHPTRLSFEILRPFLMKVEVALKEYLAKQYKEYAPKLHVKHFCISGDHSQETLEITNEPGCLPAVDIMVEAEPLGGGNFKVDDSGNRQIAYSGYRVTEDKAVEIRVPLVELIPDTDEFEMKVILSWKESVSFDPDDYSGGALTESAEPVVQEVLIPLVDMGFGPITENKYNYYSGGEVMNPKTREQAKEMFFGREEDIEEIYGMMITPEGQLKQGGIVAIYGQKRCGKSSVMHFLREKIQQEAEDTLVLTINAQGVQVKEDGSNPELFFRSLMADICMEMEMALIEPRFFDLYMELQQAGIQIPSTEEIFRESGESAFKRFFALYENWRRANHPDKYFIVLMVDEFTQAYLHMKKRVISGDFLNRWRAMVQQNSFVNIIVGQDFMDRFTTDEDVAGQNFGGAVNGLGTTNKKRLTYLSYEGSRRMIVEPLTENGKSRFVGSLGETAIARIYELTGGSAFYLMKFMNSLVNFMMRNGETMVTPDLVEKVSEGFAFTTDSNPLNKTDFDPIYNEYSYKEDGNGEEDETAISDEIRLRTKCTYELLQDIAMKANRDKQCSVHLLPRMQDPLRLEVLQSLIERGVLTDRNGEDILQTDNLPDLTVKIKVDLFRIWLRGLKIVH